MKGSYVLLIHLPGSKTIVYGRNRTAHFRRGHYAYIGSAMNGLEPRVRRHLRKDKKRHWHIDYLLEHAAVAEAILAESEIRTECAIAQVLADQFESVNGFGSSDCRCPSHLFFDTNGRRLKAQVMNTVKSIGTSPPMLGIRHRR